MTTAIYVIFLLDLKNQKVLLDLTFKYQTICPSKQRLNDPICEIRHKIFKTVVQILKRFIAEL